MASSADSADDAENGLHFMHELLELMKNPEFSKKPVDDQGPLTVMPLLAFKSSERAIRFTVASAQFGPQLHETQGVSSPTSNARTDYHRLPRSLLNCTLCSRFRPVRKSSSLLTFAFAWASFGVVTACSSKRLAISSARKRSAL